MKPGLFGVGFLFVLSCVSFLLFFVVILVLLELSFWQINTSHHFQARVLWKSAKSGLGFHTKWALERSLIPEYLEIRPRPAECQRPLGEHHAQCLAGSGAVWAGRASLLQGVSKRVGSITPKFVLHLYLLSFCSSAQDGVPWASQVADLLKSTLKCMLPSHQDGCTKGRRSRSCLTVWQNNENEALRARGKENISLKSSDFKMWQKGSSFVCSVSTQGLSGITHSVSLRTCPGALLPEVFGADGQVFMHVLHHCVGHLITEWKINCSTMEKIWMPSAFLLPPPPHFSSFNI